MEEETLRRLEKSTELSEEQIQQIYSQFASEFPQKTIMMSDFIKLCKAVMPKDEVIDFTKTVFQLFDEYNKGYLTFEEYVLATEQFKANPLFKLAWLFDNVYDQVSEK